MDEKPDRYIRERNKVSPLTVSELRYKLNQLPSEFDDLEIYHECEYTPIYFVRKDIDDGKTNLLLAVNSGRDGEDIF